MLHMKEIYTKYIQVNQYIKICTKYEQRTYNAVTMLPLLEQTNTFWYRNIQEQEHKRADRKIDIVKNRTT